MAIDEQIPDAPSGSLRRPANMSNTGRIIAGIIRPNPVFDFEKQPSQACACNVRGQNSLVGKMTPFAPAMHYAAATSSCIARLRLSCTDSAAAAEIAAHTMI